MNGQSGVGVGWALRELGRQDCMFWIFVQILRAFSYSGVEFSVEGWLADFCMYCCPDLSTWCLHSYEARNESISNPKPEL